MRILTQLRSLWRNVARREQVEREMDDELRAYVDLLASQYERDGMTPADARRRALVESGGIEQVKEATRDAWIGDAVATWGRELRYAVRSLRRSPVFLVVSIAILAIGIGGSTAVFTVVNASLLRPLPGVRNPRELVTVERVQPTRRSEVFTYADYRDLDERTTALTGLAGFNGTSKALKDSAGSARAWVSFVTDNFFEVLGVAPAAGRLFGRAGSAEPVVVIGHDLWQKRYGASARAVGMPIELEGHQYTIIGVAPPGFIGAMAQHRMEIWMPLTAGGRPTPTLNDFNLTSREGGFLRLVGRLAAGRNAGDAQRDLAAIAAALAATYPTNRGRTVHVSAGAGMTAEEREQLSRVPKLLAMAVGLLLLIACANVAGLYLVRASARRRELATRIAIGASRATLVRQVAFEGAVIAVGAGALGVFLSMALVRSATLVRTVVDMAGIDVRLDPRVLAVAIAASALTAILVSVVPGLHLLRVSPSAILKDGGGAGRRARGQRILVAAQVGASLVLLSAAAIVYGTFQRILTGHDDLDPRNVTFALLDVVKAAPDPAGSFALRRELLRTAEAHPEIARAALTSSLPPLPWSNRAYIFRHGEVPTRDALIGRQAELGLGVNVIAVSESFFDAARVPLLRGTTFAAGDMAGRERVAILSRRLAEELWPGQDPIGRLLSWPDDGLPGRPIRVVGVAADTRNVALNGGSPPAMYLPFTDVPSWNLVLVLRGRADGAITPDGLRAIVASVNPAIVVLGGRTLFESITNQVRAQRRASIWIGVFGAIALLLAAIGLYGVVAQGVLQRTRELAVRCALGATPGRIRATVLRDSVPLVAAGAVAGAVGAVAGFRVLRSFFTGVQPVDIRLATVAVGLLLVAMLVASWLPARRAARLNPVEALRSD